ncbi:hypothetical protein MANES_11G148750v8 [Manihot esculenta]|uniref:Uncharacterized protein n=1 Tax=Manihot esculenta TaxID=3983 RepID=A0ACB7GYQ9_MANES|nr:hypothetical protein MANES_11G148750v8 [Manihot esculenta]
MEMFRSSLPPQHLYLYGKKRKLFVFSSIFIVCFIVDHFGSFTCNIFLQSCREIRICLVVLILHCRRGSDSNHYLFLLVKIVTVVHRRGDSSTGQMVGGLSCSFSSSTGKNSSFSVNVKELGFLWLDKIKDLKDLSSSVWFLGVNILVIGIDVTRCTTNKRKGFFDIRQKPSITWIYI